MKKLLFVVFVVLIAISTISASGKSEETKMDVKKVELSYFGWSQIDDYPKNMFDAFQNKNPEISVITDGEGLNVGEYLQLQKVKLLSGEGIDVTALRPESRQEYVDAGYLMDLTGQPFLANYKQSFLDDIKINGKQYSIPYTLDCVGTIYNIDMFKEHGWNIPTNHEQWLALCKQIAAEGITPTINSYKDGWPILLDIMPFMHHVLIDDPMVFDKIKKGTVKYTDPIFINVFKEINDYYNSKITSDLNIGFTYDQSLTAFAQGKVAMIVHGEWCMPNIVNAEPDFEVGVMPLFANKGNEEIDNSISIGQSIGVVKFTENPEESLKLLEYISSPEGAKFLVETNSNFTPVSGASSESFDLWKDIINSKSHPFYYDQQTPAAQNEMIKQLQLMFIGEASPEQVASEVQKAQMSN